MTYGHGDLRHYAHENSRPSWVADRETENPMTTALEERMARGQGGMRQNAHEDLRTSWEADCEQRETPLTVLLPEVSREDHVAYGRGGMRHYANEDSRSSGEANREQQRPPTTSTRQDVPLPRQMLYDGKTPWESFIRPFNLLARSSGWDEEEKLFRLTHSLRGEAAEHAFRGLPAETVESYGVLEKHLAERFQDRRSASSYLSELESKRMQNRENASEYLADIRRLTMRGYPTADHRTRDTIALRHFLKGLPDDSATLAVPTNRR